jgi:hypothetical protein
MPKIAISKGFLIQFRKLGIDFRQKNVYSGISKIAFDFRPMGSFAGFSARLSLLKEGWFQIATSIAKACDVSIRKLAGFTRCTSDINLLSRLSSKTGGF